VAAVKARDQTDMALPVLADTGSARHSHMIQDMLAQFSVQARDCVTALNMQPTEGPVKGTEGCNQVHAPGQIISY